MGPDRGLFSRVARSQRFIDSLLAWSNKMSPTRWDDWFTCMSTISQSLCLPQVSGRHSAGNISLGAYCHAISCSPAMVLTIAFFVSSFRICERDPCSTEGVNKGHAVHRCLCTKQTACDGTSSVHCKLWTHSI